MPYVFLAYCREDKVNVHKLGKALEAEGISLQVDWKAPGNEKFSNEIAKAIEGAAVTLVIWSPSSTNSEWVNAEAEVAHAYGKIVHILLNPSTWSGRARPPLPYRLRGALELTIDDEIDQTGWRAVIQEARWRVDASGLDERSYDADIDLIGWCVAHRKAMLDRLVENVIKKGAVFLIGERAWIRNHLEALSTTATTAKIWQANPDVATFGEMLRFNETKRKESFQLRIWDLNTLLAATAYAFAKSADLDPMEGSALSLETMASPKAFVDRYFNWPVQRSGDASRRFTLDQAHNPEDCIEYFLCFIEAILAERPRDNSLPYIVIWNSTLIGQMLVSSKGFRGDDGEPLIVDEQRVGRHFLVGIRGHMNSNAVHSTGLIVQTDEFPIQDHPRVAQDALLFLPVLNALELQSLAEAKFGNWCHMWQWDLLISHTGGLWVWVELLFTYLDYLRGREAAGTMPSRDVAVDAARYLEELVRNPTHAIAFRFGTAPPWLTRELVEFRSELEQLAADVRTIINPLRRGMQRMATVEQDWNGRMNALLLKGLLSLASEDREGDDRSSALWKSPTVRIAPLCMLSDAAFDTVGGGDSNPGRIASEEVRASF